MRLFPIVGAVGLLFSGLLGVPFSHAATVAADDTASIEPVVYAGLTIRPRTVDFDLAKWQSRGRVVAVSSGAVGLGLRMIDNDSKTVFRFSGNDLHPTVVIELADNAPVHRVTALFEADENILLDAYLLNQLPKTLDKLGGAHLVNCTIDPGNPNQATADFEPINARYVVFRWTRLRTSKTPFCVAEVDAFSSVRAETIPPIFAENDVHITGETSIDFSNKLGVLADPPSVNEVSP